MRAKTREASKPGQKMAGSARAAWSVVKAVERSIGVQRGCESEWNGSS